MTSSDRGDTGQDRIQLGEALNFAWTTFKKRYRLLTAILASMVAAWVALEILIVTGQRFGILFWASVHLAFLVLFSGIEIGYLRVCLALYDDGKATFREAFTGLELGPRFLVGQIIYLTMIVVGLAALLVPGICLGARYAFFGFWMGAGKTSLRRSFQESAVLTKGIMFRLGWVLVSLFILNLLGASLLGLGLLITLPVSALTMTSLFRQLTPSDKLKSLRDGGTAAQP
jgi:hypothetical protein